MKRIGVFLGCVFITAYLFPQDMVKNGKAPLNPKGGRVLNIEEVLRIEGEGEGSDNGGSSLAGDPAGAAAASGSSLTSVSPVSVFPVAHGSGPAWVGGPADGPG
ncbi:MAG: hypothetical protein KJ768_10090, partial [Acidobacteria bacterium]|nr:hypothetical protein [Acidobacteriota bacterium]